MSLSSLLTYEWNHLFGSLLTLELIFWVIVLLPYINIFFSHQNGVVSPLPLLIVIFWSFLWFLLMDDCNYSLGVADYTGNYFSERSNYRYVSWFFLLAKWCRFTVTVVDCYILKFICHYSSRMGATTCSDRCLHRKFFAERSYYHHTSSFFPPSTMASFNHNHF